jgi:hypothetical protein
MYGKVPTPRVNYKMGRNYSKQLAEEFFNLYVKEVLYE